MTTQTIPTRAEVAVADTWNASSIFATDTAWEAAMTQARATFATVRQFQGHLGDNPNSLADFFVLRDQLTNTAYKVRQYANMFYATDTADSTAAAKISRARSFIAQVQSELAFAEPEMLGIGFETLHRWGKEEARLTRLSQYFDQLEKRAAHIRSAEVEAVLSLAGDVFSTAADIHKTLTDADMRFDPATSPALAEPLPVAQGTIGARVTHPDREIRRTAWENYADQHLAYKNSMAGCISTVVKQHAFQANVRGYPSAMEAAVSQNHIPPQVFHNLIDTFRRHLPTWHRYWGLRRKALGLEKLREFDVKAPLTAKPPHVPFDQAMQWIAEGLQPLGDKYVQTMLTGVNQKRWVDKYPNQGKRAGAFSSGTQGTEPFILMSYTDDLFSMSTLAHELGHSMHSWLTWQTQPFVYANYSIFLAEVASNFNQALVRAHLFEKIDARDFQIALIEEAMSNFHRYFFIMPTLARFEFEIHRRVEAGQALPADDLIELMADLYTEAYGPEVEVDRARTGITWAEFSTHMYLNFYVYQYATGISGAHAFARRILDEEPNAVSDYLGFLSAGSSRYPLDVLRQAGVDMLSPEPVEETFAVLGGLVDRLEALLAE